MGSCIFKVFYEVCKSRGGDCKWMTCACQPYIIPRRSIICYRVMSDRLGTDDTMRKWGMIITSYYCLCRRFNEFVVHFFFECPCHTPPGD